MAVITDSITERTAGAGVTVDGLLIKDGLLPDVTPADIGAEAAGAAATAVSSHESAYDHANLPTTDEAAALAAYQSALAAAEAGQVLTASGPGAAAFAAAAGGPSLSDYSNVIVVDAGGNGDYTSVSAALATAPANSVIVVFGQTTEPDNIGFSPFNSGITVVLTAGSVVNMGGSYIFVVQSPGLKILGNGTIAASGGQTLYTLSGDVEIGNISIINTAPVVGVAAQLESTGKVIMDSTRLSGANAIKASQNFGAGSRLRFVASGAVSKTGAAMTNAPIYHSVMSAAPTNISVATGNYSNIANGVTWPAVP